MGEKRHLTRKKKILRWVCICSTPDRRPTFRENLLWVSFFFLFGSLTYVKKRSPINRIEFFFLLSFSFSSSLALPPFFSPPRSFPLRFISNRRVSRTKSFIYFPVDPKSRLNIFSLFFPYLFLYYLLTFD